MRKLLIFILSAVVSLSTFGCSAFGVSGRNVTSVSVSDMTVSFSPKCPSCGHEEMQNSAVVDKGDTYTSYIVCTKCFEEYVIEIKR